MQRNSVSLVCALLFSTSALGCSAEGSGAGDVPWSEQQTDVLQADRSVTRIAGRTSGGACVEFESMCLKPQDKCAGLAADVVLDGSGKVLDYLCYPEESTLSVEELQEQRGDIAQNENNTVLVLDDVDDGADVEGNVSVDANNVVIYGSSPDTAVISGSLTLDGNNGLVRGVRIQGDVTVRKNGAVLAFCVIEGNLVLEGNNTQVLACDVLGSITVRGNNTKLYGVRLAGPLTTDAKLECRDSVSFTDSDGDNLVEASELGSPLAC